MSTINDLQLIAAVKAGYWPTGQLRESATVMYFFFMNEHGAWYMMKQDFTSGSGSIKYSKGNDRSSYDAAILAPGSLTYDYPNVIFK